MLPFFSLKSFADFLEKSLLSYFAVNRHHTIYKYPSVRSFLGVCGCMRVCDTSLEPSWHPHERPPAGQAPARAARPQLAKMCFYYIRHNFSAVFRLGRIPKRSMRLYNTLCHTKMLQRVHPAPARPQCLKLCYFSTKGSSEWPF